MAKRFTDTRGFAANRYQSFAQHPLIAGLFEPSESKRLPGRFTVYHQLITFHADAAGFLKSIEKALFLLHYHGGANSPGRSNGTQSEKVTP
jgi:hypothetical protein